MSKVFLVKLKKKIKSGQDFELLLNKLIERIKENKAISANPMLDGLIIGFMLKCKRFLVEIIVDKSDIGRVLDATLQQIEQSLIWLSNNEDILITL